MKFLHSLKAKVKARKAYLAYAFAALLLAAGLAFMIIAKFSHAEENAIAAAENGQLKVFDLNSGKEVKIAAILHGEPISPDEYAAKAGAPAMPIKQADIMFIVSNLGGNTTDSEKAIKLPAAFMLSFSPYAELSLELSQAARAGGHVTLVDLPVQSKDSTETPGNLALLVDNNDFKNTRNFEAALSKVYEPAGVLTPPNDIFTHSAGFNTILRLIAQHKIFLAYAGEGEDIDTQAKDNDIGLLKVDLVLNDSEKPEDMAKQLANVETLIAKTGLAVVMIKSPSTPSLDAIGKWAGGLKSRNINLISSQR